jgi:hypothetical protein
MTDVRCRANYLPSKNVLCIVRSCDRTLQPSSKFRISFEGSANKGRDFLTKALSLAVLGESMVTPEMLKL